MYDVIFQEPAKRFIRKLDGYEKNRIISKIEELKENPKLGKPLTAGLAGYWSLRIGKYRAIYFVKDRELVIVVLDIGHRKNIY
jgi:mRNA interferase RelE/StbE